MIQKMMLLIQMRIMTIYLEVEEGLNKVTAFPEEEKNEHHHQA